MKNIVLFISLFQLISCATIDNIEGIYSIKNKYKYQALSEDNNYSQIELHKNGHYILKKAEVTFSPVIEQGDYASKGKWNRLSNDVIELVSQDQHLEKIPYSIRQEKKYSQDSLYINVNIPHNLPDMGLSLNFNNKKNIIANDLNIRISKSEYLWKTDNINLIELSIAKKLTGKKIYKERMLFNIFKENINTDYNYITVDLPSLQRCTLEFEPLYDNVYIKSRNILYWKRKEWIKQ